MQTNICSQLYTKFEKKKQKKKSSQHDQKYARSFTPILKKSHKQSSQPDANKYMLIALHIWTKSKRKTTI